MELLLIAPREVPASERETPRVYYRSQPPPRRKQTIYAARPGSLHELLPRFAADPDFRVISYSAWRQRPARRKTSPALRLESVSPAASGWVRVFENTILLAQLDVEYDPRASATGQDFSKLDEYGQSVWQPGTLPDAIYETGETPELDNTSAAPEPAGAAPYVVATELPAPADIYRINQRRRIRFGEVHYFDHPHFGVLLKVSRGQISLEDIERAAEALAATDDQPESVRAKSAPAARSPDPSPPPAEPAAEP